MRISDWSSDVCSSDLVHRQRNDLGLLDRFPARAHVGVGDQRIPEFVADQRADPHTRDEAAIGLQHRDDRIVEVALGVDAEAASRDRREVDVRSEEHTSELQSLMRNSYAVFCLKKKK